jgi:hypothetical protein
MRRPPELHENCGQAYLVPFGKKMPASCAGARLPLVGRGLRLVLFEQRSLSFQRLMPCLLTVTNRAKHPDDKQKEGEIEFRIIIHARS